jgi:hypothetical protein
MIDQHFWLLCGVWVGVGNGLLIWTRRGKLANEGVLTEDDVKRAAVTFSVSMLIPCALMWALQQSLGPDSNPLFINWPTPQKEIAFTLQVSAWVALLFWVFVRDGDKTLSTYMPELGNWPAFMSTPTAVKIGTLLTVLVGVVAIFAPH